jgi:hypothetical protein
LNLYSKEKGSEKISSPKMKAFTAWYFFFFQEKGLPEIQIVKPEHLLQ